MALTTQILAKGVEGQMFTIYGSWDGTGTDTSGTIPGVARLASFHAWKTTGVPVTFAALTSGDLAITFTNGDAGFYYIKGIP